jgi:hypothetical protein
MAHDRAYAVRFDGDVDGYESLSCADGDEASFGLASACYPAGTQSKPCDPQRDGDFKTIALRLRQLVGSVILPLPAQASHFRNRNFPTSPGQLKHVPEKIRGLIG